MRVIGLISGTSVDGIDAALVEISGTEDTLTVELLAGETYPYPPALRDRILAVCAGASLSMTEFAELDDAIAIQFAHAALQIQHNHSPANLIGSHGQTVFHRPPQPSAKRIPDTDTLASCPLGYSLQLGRGAVIAQLTGIPTISNFRAADIAAGGQGAPLVSALDVALLRHENYDRAVQNIGGIGNLTYLPAKHKSDAISGWDTGPGNVLIDLAAYQLSKGQQTYDRDGAWAASGTPDQALVDRWLQHPFFQQPPPKSTGRELFGVDYLHHCLAQMPDRSPADSLATLTELTARSIAHSYQQYLPRLPEQILLCGGGSKNPYLRQRIQAHMPSATVLTTDEVGLSADFKEAIAFSVLAYWRQLEIPGNLPQVTGAITSVLLGEINQVRKFCP